jgi:signal transduction histidine kinase
LVSSRFRWYRETGLVRSPVRNVKCEHTGIGIGEDFRTQLFEEFKQESKGLGRTHEGSGLGLAITGRLVEMMNGTVNVESASGEGTRVAVAFPRGAAPDRDGAGE